MKSVHTAAACALALAALLPATAFANPQHERMKRCNAEARAQELKGDERRSFMSSCLKGRHEKPAPAAAATDSAPSPVAPAAALPTPAEATPAPQVRQGSEDGQAANLAAVEAREKRRQCNRAATEQSLSGAARKAFVNDCMAG